MSDQESDPRPAPLVGADVDISGLDGFMLNVQRLFASELWALSTGDEFKASMGLWGRAWQQNPPGSLPKDERIIAAFSGAGKNWSKVRVMALRGFVECSDGRLYHRVLCEDVINAHRKRQAFRERTKNATEARRQRNEPRSDQRDDHRNVVVDADVTSVQGQGQKKEDFSLRSKCADAGVSPKVPADKPPHRSRPPRQHPFTADAFEVWYGGYPHKVGRAAAEKAFAKVQASDAVAFGDLIAGRDAYVRSKPADRAWCNPATWLNENRWLDKPAEPQASGTIVPKPAAVADLGGGVTAPHSSIRSFWSRGRWSDEWGPPPGKPGCRIPPETLSKIMNEEAA